MSADTGKYPTVDWLHNPPSWNLTETVPGKYLKIVNEDLAEMNAVEKAAVDLAEADAAMVSEKAEAVKILTAPGPLQKALYAMVMVMAREIRGIKASAPRPNQTIEQLLPEAITAINNGELDAL